MNISAETRSAIQAEVAGFPPLADDQRNAVAALTPGKDDAEAA